MKVYLGLRHQRSVAYGTVVWANPPHQTLYPPKDVTFPSILTIREGRQPWLSMNYIFMKNIWLRCFCMKKKAHFSVLIKKGGDGGCLEIWNAAIRSSSAPFAPLFPPCSIPSGFSSNMFLVVCPAAWLTVHTLSQHNSAVQKPLKTRRNSISRFLLFFF